MQESSVVKKRLRFVEPMTDGCREFGISRKTGFQPATGNMAVSLSAISRGSRCVISNQLPPQIESLIVSLAREKSQSLALPAGVLAPRRL
jgi:hypothetical protein